MKKSTASVLMDGLLSGILGYAVISVYFAASNIVAGLPALDTIQRLGAGLLGGSDPGHMIAYNGLHLGVFLVLGSIAALLIHEVEMHPAWWYVLFLVAISGFIFSYVFMTVVAGRFAGLDAYSVAVGNLAALLAMGLLLFLRHPGASRAVRDYSQAEEREYLTH